MQDKEFAAILQDEPMQPLALVPLTEEEQVCNQRALASTHPCSCWHIPTHPIAPRYTLGSKAAILLCDRCGSELTFLTFLPFAFSIFSLQRNFSMSVNSVAVLRLMGKGVGGATPAGVVRGRGATRGGRGETIKKTKTKKQQQWDTRDKPVLYLPS